MSTADNDHLFKEFLKKQANVFGCFFVDKKNGAKYAYNR